MFLKRFTRPKWQHPDAEIRRQALAGLPADDPALDEMALTDTEAALRSAAICACNRIETVAKAWRDDLDAGVRMTALRRLGLLLAGQPRSADDSTQRLALLAEIEDAEVLSQVARQARLPELRKAALLRVQDPAALQRIATEDDNADLRLLALERIESAETLNEIARQWRGRDKRLHRRARELADAASEREQRPQRIQATCEAMEALAAGRATLAHDAIKTLVDDWSGLSADADEDARQRFEQALQAAQQALDKQQQARQRRQAQDEVCKTLEAQIETLRGRHELDSEAIAEVDQRLGRIKQDWQAAGGDDDASGGELQQTYQQLLHRAIEQRERLLQHHQRAEALRGMLDKGQQWLGDIKLTRRRASQWLEDYESLPLPADTALAQELRGRGKDLGQRLVAQAESLKSKREQALELVLAQLRELAELLEQNQLQPSISAFNAVRAALDELGPLPAERQRSIDRQMQHASSRIRELRGWRRWGSNHAREELIEQAETLVGSELPPRTLADRIRALRGEWQKLDRTDSSTNEKLWEKFNELCSRAYEPCQAYFDQLGRERDALLEARQQQIQALEDWAAAIDWEAPDWRAIDRHLQQARRAWREGAEVRGRDRRLLEDRFHKAVDSVEARLAPERERNLAERQRLVEQAAELAVSEDVREAISRAKQLQQQWVVTVAAKRRREDQKLWEAFRGHLDQVFSRRDAEANAGRQQREAAATALSALCEELETLGRVSEDEQQLRQALRESGARRRALGELPRNREAALDQRLEKALQALQQRLDHLARSRTLSQLDACAAHGQCCTQLEESIIAGVSDLEQRLVDCQRAADDLPELDAQTRAGFDARREAARDIDPKSETTRALLARNQTEMEQLTLRLEILAGIDSPPELQRQRLAMQVDRLSAVMGEGDSTALGKPAQIIELLRQWHLCGPLPSDARRGLQARIQKVRDSLESPSGTGQ